MDLEWMLLFEAHFFHPHQLSAVFFQMMVFQRSGSVFFGTSGLMRSRVTYLRGRVLTFCHLVAVQRSMIEGSLGRPPRPSLVHVLEENLLQQVDEWFLRSVETARLQHPQAKSRQQLKSRFSKQTQSPDSM